jgi:hypothetical protein
MPPPTVVGARYHTLYVPACLAPSLVPARRARISGRAAAPRVHFEPLVTGEGRQQLRLQSARPARRCRGGHSIKERATRHDEKTLLRHFTLVIGRVQLQYRIGIVSAAGQHGE